MIDIGFTQALERTTMTDPTATKQRRVTHADVVRVRLVPAVILGLLAILLIL